MAEVQKSAIAPIKWHVVFLKYAPIKLELSKWAGHAGPGRKSPKNAGFGHKNLGPFKTGPF